MVYQKPSVEDVGSVRDLTLSSITKDNGTGDVIHIAGQPPITVPGGSVISVS